MDDARCRLLLSYFGYISAFALCVARCHLYCWLIGNFFFFRRCHLIWTLCQVQCLRLCFGGVCWFSSPRRGLSLFGIISIYIYGTAGIPTHNVHITCIARHAQRTAIQTHSIQLPRRRQKLSSNYSERDTLTNWTYEYSRPFVVPVGLARRGDTCWLRPFLLA